MASPLPAEQGLPLGPSVLKPTCVIRMTVGRLQPDIGMGFGQQPLTCFLATLCESREGYLSQNRTGKTMTSSFQTSSSPTQAQQNLRLMLAFIAGASVGMVGVFFSRSAALIPAAAIQAPSTQPTARSTDPLSLSNPSQAGENPNSVERARSTNPVTFLPERGTSGPAPQTRSFRPQSSIRETRGARPPQTR